MIINKFVLVYMHRSFPMDELVEMLDIFKTDTKITQKKQIITSQI
jgi:hypothetical protein